MQPPQHVDDRNEADQCIENEVVVKEEIEFALTNEHHDQFQARKAAIMEKIIPLQQFDKMMLQRTYDSCQAFDIFRALLLTKHSSNLRKAASRRKWLHG